MSREACPFYYALFTEDSLLAVVDEYIVIACIPSLISNDLDASLTHQFTLSEVEEVVFGMNNGKAPGSNGFPVEFFKDFWDIVKLDLLEVVRESFQNKIKLFRPIVLCNVAYNIIRKLIIERHKSCLPVIICEEKGGFVVPIIKVWMGWWFLMRSFIPWRPLRIGLCSLSWIWPEHTTELNEVFFKRFC